LVKRVVPDGFDQGAYLLGSSGIFSDLSVFFFGFPCFLAYVRRTDCQCQMSHQNIALSQKDNLAYRRVPVE
jgi:hypothetical protein